MPQSSAVIANLQSALGCAGKCDCCASLQSQIDSLNQKFNQYIPASDKQLLIDESVNLGLPLAVGLVMSQVLPKIAAVEVTAASAAGAAATLSPLLPLVGVAAAILNLLSTPVTLNVLGGRIEAVEAWSASLDRGISQALGFVGLAASKANEALRLGELAVAEANTAAEKADKALRSGELAVIEANTAAEKAKEALRQAMILPKAIPGIQGIPGERGIPGIQGIPGERGFQGLQGIQGLQGERGQFNMAELGGINSLLSNISGQLGVIAAGVVANGEQIKKVPIEVIDDNRKLALDTPNKLKSALCEELQNGQCFPSAMDRWIGNQPLSKVPNEIVRLTPIIVNTGSIVNNQNNAITNLGNQVNNQTNVINNVTNQIKNQTNAITNTNNQINNQTNAITNANNQINNQNNAITNLSNQFNNQTNAITNQINNQFNAITNVNNTVNNINIEVQEIKDILDEPCNPCQTLGWIEVSVPTVSCILISGVWVPQINTISVKVLATEEGDEVAQTVNNYQEIAKANTELCLAKNKDKEEQECYAAIPDFWLIRPEHHRPQLIFQFGEVMNGQIGSPKYPITIPHPLREFRPNGNTLPKYRKGNWEIIYVLKDNSKIVLHALNEIVGKELLNACLAIVDPAYLKGGYLSKNSKVEVDVPLSEIEVAPKMAKFFSEGRKNNKPDWLVRF